MPDALFKLAADQEILVGKARREKAVAFCPEPGVVCNGFKRMNATNSNTGINPESVLI